MTGRCNDKSTLVETLMINDRAITDTGEIAGEFCSFFSNIGKQYAEAIPNSNRTPHSFLQGQPNRHSAYFTPTGPTEIKSILKSFKSKRSSGDDGISMEFLKQIADSISLPIAMIVNMSLEQGVVPDAMKLAKVIPIYKAKSRDSLTNYRPISLLSNISKILEKVVHRRLYSFITKHDLLYGSQYGFRPQRSTIDALAQFTADVLPSLDNKEFCLSVYLDLSKAFDTIKHSTLLAKLAHYGIRGQALDWFRSYLAQRRQYVSCGGKSSNILAVEYGVPQGSVLGPLLFIIYSNDLPMCLGSCKTILFADDTTLYITGRNIRDMSTKMNADLSVLSDWFRANKLSANPLKTKFILFSRKGVRPSHEITLSMDGHLLDQVQNTKFLGLHFDENLIWDIHIDNCRKKVARGIFAMNMAKNVLKHKHLKILYHSLIHSHLSYGTILWGNTYQKHLHRLEVAQKRAIRVIAGVPYNSHSSELFQKLDILKLRDIYNSQIGKFMYNFTHGELPRPLSRIYIFHGDGHGHNTRHRADPKAPIVNSDTMRRSYLYTGPNLWIALSDNLKSSNSILQFKKQLKRVYISGY